MNAKRMQTMAPIASLTDPLLKQSKVQSTFFSKAASLVLPLHDS
jgi:hypothetical protein